MKTLTVHPQPTTATGFRGGENKKEETQRAKDHFQTCGLESIDCSCQSMLGNLRLTEQSLVSYVFDLCVFLRIKIMIIIIMMMMMIIVIKKNDNNNNNNNNNDNNNNNNNNNIMMMMVMVMIIILINTENCVGL